MVAHETLSNSILVKYSLGFAYALGFTHSDSDSVADYYVTLLELESHHQPSYFPQVVEFWVCFTFSFFYYFYF